MDATDTEYLYFDPKSPVPKAQQIRDQVRKFSSKSKINSEAYASMDAFKEMMEIEQKFGAIKLGIEEPHIPQKVTFEDDEEKPSLWSHLAQSTLFNTNTKFKQFLSIID